MIEKLKEKFFDKKEIEIEEIKAIITHCETLNYRNYSEAFIKFSSNYNGNYMNGILRIKEYGE